MFVIRRPFKNYGQTMLPGLQVEPGDIKRFKSRLKDRYIIEVTETSFDKWNDFFLKRFGVGLPKEDETSAEPEGVQLSTDVEPAVTQKVTDVEPVRPKVIVKAN